MGYFFFASSISFAFTEACTWQYPSLKINFFSGIFSAIYLPKFSSGIKKIFLFGRFFTIFIALDDVTLKKNGAVDLSENFDGDSVRPLYLYCEAIGASGDRTLTPSTLSTSILSVNKAQVSVKKGKKTTVKLTAPSVAKISYKTSNKKVATVTSKGVVKGVKKGKATITVSAAGVSKKVKVTVK